MFNKHRLLQPGGGERWPFPFEANGGAVGPSRQQALASGSLGKSRGPQRREDTGWGDVKNAMSMVKNRRWESCPLPCFSGERVTLKEIKNFLSTGWSDSIRVGFWVFVFVMSKENCPCSPLAEVIKSTVNHTGQNLGGMQRRKKTHCAGSLSTVV